MQRPGQDVALPTGEIDDVAGFRENPCGAAGDLASGLGQHHAAPAALHQLHAELFFEFLNLHRKRRLGHGALFRRPAEMFQTRDGFKISELFQRDH